MSARYKLQAASCKLHGGNGWKWNGSVGNGNEWKWMEMDGNGSRWVEMNGNGGDRWL
jgi:hypothetical protein